MINRRYLVATIPLLGACQLQNKVISNDEFEVVDSFTDCSISPSGQYIAISLKNDEGRGILIFDRLKKRSIIYRLNIDKIHYFDSIKVDDYSTIVGKVVFPQSKLNMVAVVGVGGAILFDVGSGEVYSPYLFGSDLRYFYRGVGDPFAKLIVRRRGDGDAELNFQPMQNVSSTFFAGGYFFVVGVPGRSAFETIEIDVRENYRRTFFLAQGEAEMWRADAVRRLSQKYEMLTLQGISLDSGMVFTGRLNGERYMLIASESGDQISELPSHVTCARVGLNSDDVVFFSVIGDDFLSGRFIRVDGESFYVKNLISTSTYQDFEVDHA